MNTLIELREKLIKEAKEVIAEKDKPDRERLSLVFTKVTALSRAIGLIVCKFHKDFFELSKDYILNLINSCFEEININSQKFCSESFKIDHSDPEQIFKAVIISNAFWMIANVLYMKQKWINIHLPSLIKVWQNFYTECKLALPPGNK